MNYSQKYFINPAVEYGIQSYINFSNGNTYNKSHIFEMNVISILIEIFGEKAILLPYKIDNEKAFKNNLLIYDYDENCMNIFLNNFNNYYAYIKDYKTQKSRTNTMVYVELALLDMISRKSQKKKISQSTIDAIDGFIYGNEHINKLRSLISTEKEQQVFTKWAELKNELLKQDEEIEKVELLDKQDYMKYGISINSVELLNAKDIEKINAAIQNEDNNTFKVIPKKKKMVITCGNGFVDVLVILSIVCTEIMIGSIILAIFAG